MIPEEPPVAPRPHRRRRSPLLPMTAIVVVVAAAGSLGVIRAANARTADIERVAGLGDVLAVKGDNAVRTAGDRVPVGTLDLDTPVTYGTENYLLVGSDSREGFAPDTDFIGSTADVGGQRSDTMMILHQEGNGGASLISVPRDLWVPIYGTSRSNRVNTAFSDGPLTLVATISEALDIPIHHYVEVDFQGFQRIVDDIGGVEICVDRTARDTHSGLWLDIGCQTLTGDRALAYARSRYYQEVGDDGKWRTDGRADLGRIERQQSFLRAAIGGALRKIESDPFSTGDTLAAITDSVKIDDALEPIRAAQVLRQAFQAGLRTFALPVYNDTVGSAAVLRLSDNAEPLLDYLRGTGPAPDEFDTSADTGGDAPTTTPPGG
ncbi:MAG TPA: LCP family protein [Ilumatobacter sp.]|nr:LCP family protein [Ilumatobacter sp.]